MKPFFPKNSTSSQFKRRSHKSTNSHNLLTIPPTCRTTTFYKRPPRITKSFKHVSHMDSQAIPGTTTIFPSVHPFSAEPCTSIRCLWFFQAFPCFPRAPPLLCGSPTVPGSLVFVWKQEKTEQHCPVC